MKFLVFLPLFLLVIFLNQPTTSVGADLIKETCKKTKYSDLCVKTLKSNPKSSTANSKGLVHIILEANLANGKATLAKVSKMFKDARNNKYLKNSLEVCADIYESAYDDFSSAIQSLEKNDFSSAKVQLSAAFGATGTCRDAFAENPKAQTPPDLTRMEDYYAQLSSIALAVLNKITG